MQLQTEKTNYEMVTLPQTQLETGRLTVAKNAEMELTPIPFRGRVITP